MQDTRMQQSDMQDTAMHHARVFEGRHQLGSMRRREKREERREMIFFSRENAADGAPQKLHTKRAPRKMRRREKRKREERGGVKKETREKREDRRGMREEQEEKREQDTLMCDILMHILMCDILM